MVKIALESAVAGPGDALSPHCLQAFKQVPGGYTASSWSPVMFQMENVLKHLQLLESL